MMEELTDLEKQMFNRAVTEIVSSASENAEKRPAITTLIEEVAEAILSSRGKHDDFLKTEIVQIGSICINILWQLNCGYEDHICNIGQKSRYWEDKEQE